MLSISQPAPRGRVLPGARLRRALLLVAVTGCFTVRAADLADARDRFLSGDYSACVTLAESTLTEGPAGEEWHGLLIRGLVETGRYPEAYAAATNALTAYPRSLVLRWVARDAFLHNGEVDAAASLTMEIARRAMSNPRGYRDTRSRVAIGRALLVQGFDPKQVLDVLYEPAQQSDPTEREVYLASGGLALEKHDFELAARQFREGLNRLPDDPDLHFGLACAYLPSEPGLALEALESAFERNSNHVGSLLLLAERKIDAEAYDAAEQLLDAVRAVNPVHPEAWAYQAVLAHLRNQPDAEESARARALRFWPTNPRVDHLIGLKLSQKYRFQEGARCQVQALQFDGGYQPALLQLAQDLLRLGREEEGWPLAEKVQSMDAYDVTANNLVALREVLEAFQVLTNAHFTLRMNPHEARVYGERALALLERARSDLSAKYGSQLRQPTTVDIFHRQSDFAVRTFGMPQNHGFLGVCFGPVITANSPASRPGQPFNWESMLWHEFCHVVTLELTGNKIPRWLSEGISVYEERQADPTWGEQLTPQYRRMLLDDSLTPVSRLSAAFLNPPSGLHLQFAYYQSSLVVEFLVERHGQPTLIALLQELGSGTPINEALEIHAAPLEVLEPEFVEFAHAVAHGLAPQLDWAEPGPASFELPGRALSADGNAERPMDWPGSAGLDAADAWEEWAQAHPTNFWVMMRRARDHVSEERWTEAQAVLEQLFERMPGYVGDPAPHRLLAETYCALGNTNAARRVLSDLAACEDEAMEAYRQLMEWASHDADWHTVIENAQRYLAADPLVAPPYRHWARAAEAAGRPDEAMTAYRSLLELDPVDPAELHFRLARLLHQAGDPAARRHLLQSLEEAPRHREALRLLLELNDRERTEPESTAGGQET